MAGQEMRQFMVLVEGYNNLQEQLLNEIFAQDMILHEDIMSDIKQKATKWSAKAGKLTSEFLPALQKRYETLQDKMQSTLGKDAAEQFEKTMDNKGGQDWKSNLSKMAAAVAVASALLANPAQAQSLDQRLATGIVGALQFGKQNAPQYYAHKDPRVVSGELTPERR